MEAGIGCLWLSKIAIEENVVTNWEYQSTLEDKRPTETGGCCKQNYQYAERLISVSRTTQHQVKIIQW